MYITKKALPDLSPDEYRACHYLNMRGSGMMMYSLIDNRTNPNAYAVMCWANDKLLGWALLIPHGFDYLWRSSAHQRKKSKYVVQFYVRKPYRNKGIGGRLMREVNMMDSTPTVIPHDPTSADFFASYAVVTDKTRRGMLTAAMKKKKGKAA